MIGHRAATWVTASVALLAAVLLAGSVTMVAQARNHHGRHRARCAPRAAYSSPHLLRPCNRAVVRSGSTVSFVVRDTNPNARRFRPFLIVALSRHTMNGELNDTGGGDGLFVQMHPVRGHKGLYAHSTRHDVLVDFPGYWLTTPRTYYVQIAQVDSRAIPFGDRYSPVEKLVVKP